MRKKVLAYLLFLSPFCIKAQNGNGGMSQENSTLKIEYQGMNNSYTIVKVTNKDTCDKNVRVQWGSEWRTKMITAQSSDTFNLVQQQPCFIMATSISSCNSATFGSVEINYCQVLDVKFEYIKTRQISKNEIEVEFKVSNSDGESEFNIQISKDGRNFRTIHIMSPEPLVMNKIYKVKIKI